MAQGINKAIPPTTMEFPDYEFREFPKKLGVLPTGDKVIAESKAHEIELRAQYGIPKGSKPNHEVTAEAFAKVGEAMQNASEETAGPIVEEPVTEPVAELEKTKPGGKKK